MRLKTYISIKVERAGGIQFVRTEWQPQSKPAVKRNKAKKKKIESLMVVGCAVSWAFTVQIVFLEQ
jgi:hypothetical protein